MRLWAALAVALLQLPVLSTERLALGARPCPAFALPPLGATSGQLRHQIAVFSGVFKACRGRARGPALQGAAPRWDAGDAGEKDTAALLARMQRLEERLAAGEERARARISELGERLTVVEKRARVCIRVAQYNVLASYLGNNREPWFLYGALDMTQERDRRRARSIQQRHAARDPKTGLPLFPGWPNYVEGILTEAEIQEVETRDEDVFAWRVREPKLVKTILDLDADLISLVELDRFESFRPTFAAAGFGSLWVKRPRPTSDDGCAILFRSSKMQLIDSHNFTYTDDLEGKRVDRVAVMALFNVRNARSDSGGDDSGIIFVSTHLARNFEVRLFFLSRPSPSCQHTPLPPGPNAVVRCSVVGALWQCMQRQRDDGRPLRAQDEKQSHIRVRQVCQLFVELRAFADRHDAVQRPVIIAGDWNAESIQRLRFMALALFSLTDLVKDAHPLLLEALNVPTSRTSTTLQRSARIDHLIYQESLLQLIARGPSCPQVPDVIPSAEHPSDHLPVWADFQIASQLQRARDCAKNYVRCLLGHQALLRRPLTAHELELAFAFFDLDGDQRLDIAQLRYAIGDLGVTEREDGIDAVLAQLLQVAAGPEEAPRVDLEGFAACFYAAHESAMRRANTPFRRELLQTFALFDRDGSGCISRDELVDVLLACSPIGVSDQCVQTILDDYGCRVEDEGGCEAEQQISLEAFVDLCCLSTRKLK